MTKKIDAEREEARQELLTLLPPGSTVYTILRHVSRSGMSRTISFFTIAFDPLDGDEPYLRCIDWAVAKVCGYTRDQKNDGLKVSGCGMDMGFAVISNLGYALWPNGTDEPHGMRNGEPDSNGEYALKHRWL